MAFAAAAGKVWLIFITLATAGVGFGLGAALVKGFGTAIGIFLGLSGFAPAPFFSSVLTSLPDIGVFLPAPFFSSVFTSLMGTSGILLAGAAGAGSGGLPNVG